MLSPHGQAESPHSSGCAPRTRIVLSESPRCCFPRCVRAERSDHVHNVSVGYNEPDVPEACSIQPLPEGQGIVPGVGVGSTVCSPRFVPQPKDTNIEPVCVPAAFNPPCHVCNDKVQEVRMNGSECKSLSDRREQQMCAFLCSTLKDTTRCPDCAERENVALTVSSGRDIVIRVGCSEAKPSGKSPRKSIECDVGVPCHGFFHERPLCTQMIEM